MYERARHINDVTRAFTILRSEVSLRSGLSLYDMNIHAENFYRDLFNLIFDWKLKNLNCVTKNAAYIDLVDRTKRKAIQVTSQNDSLKIKKSISGFFGQPGNEKLKLKVLLIGESKKKYKFDFTNGGKYKFDSAKDIVDLNDLAKLISDKEPDELRKIADFLIRQTASIPPPSETTEVVTIMRLIEYLSDDKNYIDGDQIIAEVDPDRKINHRFGQHAGFITQQYLGLISIYFESLSTAKNAAGLDGVRADKISSYLRSKSDSILTEMNGNAKSAIEALIDYFEQKLTLNGWKCDRGAIEFYLLSELIACNVFPNPTLIPNVN